MSATTGILLLTLSMFPHGHKPYKIHGPMPHNLHGHQAGQSLVPAATIVDLLPPQDVELTSANRPLREPPIVALRGFQGGVLSWPEGQLTSLDEPSMWNVVAYGELSALVRFPILPDELQAMAAAQDHGYVQLFLDRKPLANYRFLAGRDPASAGPFDEISLTYQYHLPCPAPGMHILQARYVFGGLWSGLSAPLRFDVQPPRRPRIIAIYDDHNVPRPLATARLVPVTGDAIRLKLANVKRDDRVIAYLDGRRIVETKVEDCCNVRISMQGGAAPPPGVYRLSVSVIPGESKCSLASPASEEVMIHYFNEDSYTVRSSEKCFWPLTDPDDSNMPLSKEIFRDAWLSPPHQDAQTSVGRKRVVRQQVDRQRVDGGAALPLDARRFQGQLDGPQLVFASASQVPDESTENLPPPQEDNAEAQEPGNDPADAAPGGATAEPTPPAIEEPGCPGQNGVVCLTDAELKSQAQRAHQETETAELAAYQCRIAVESAFSLADSIVQTAVSKRQRAEALLNRAKTGEHRVKTLRRTAIDRRRTAMLAQEKADLYRAKATSNQDPDSQTAVRLDASAQRVETEADRLDAEAKRAEQAANEAEAQLQKTIQRLSSELDKAKQRERLARTIHGQLENIRNATNQAHNATAGALANAEREANAAQAAVTRTGAAKACARANAVFFEANVALDSAKTNSLAANSLIQQLTRSTDAEVVDDAETMDGTKTDELAANTANAMAQRAESDLRASIEFAKRDLRVAAAESIRPEEVAARIKPAWRQNFYFVSTAAFPDRGFGPQGQVIDREGVVIYEDMRFTWDSDGKYWLRFRANRPAKPATLRLRLLVQTEEGGPWYTITIKPIKLDFTSDPTAKFMLAKRQSEDDLQEIDVDGHSAVLQKFAGKVHQIRREGTARFGFGEALYRGKIY